jgi:hypothetical protein
MTPEPKEEKEEKEEEQQEEHEEERVVEEEKEDVKTREIKTIKRGPTPICSMM